MKKKNNNKIYGLNKERQLKRFFEKEPGVLFVSRSRGSFGAFDLQVYFEDNQLLISIKSVRKKYVSFKKEIAKLKATKVPTYCKKALYVYYSPKAKSERRGWIVEYYE